ncbi:hypothetical protein AVEN_69986-1 [Araneus ventricosus]|uniref:Uncharacterized protein n=1 Tax=Araneus ventricosus TaxID=182803 RepID=A0A4Y2N6E7_ARAVE|nr:hypothetical protein AVEN_69986-1 [Araneus ventricosus]
MNFLKTLGLVMVLVGYAMAGAISVARAYHIPELHHEDDLRDDYDESITVRKPFLDASYPISKEPVDKTGSPKRPDVEYKAEDGKSNVHSHDEETDGGYVRVARALSRILDVAEAGRPGDSGFGGALSEVFRSPGTYRKGEEESEEEYA